ncbi:hypothetical protein ABZ590_04135 [Streptomyces hirsutus]|uniref:hypothetical protein n=1 Tax=Streptomyces hirsutus TaxID=35620 RepID=UPI0033FA2E63
MSVAWWGLGAVVTSDAASVFPDRPPAAARARIRGAGGRHPGAGRGHEDADARAQRGLDDGGVLGGVVRGQAADEACEGLEVLGVAEGPRVGSAEEPVGAGGVRAVGQDAHVLAAGAGPGVHDPVGADDAGEGLPGAGTPRAT